MEKNRINIIDDDFDIVYLKKNMKTIISCILIMINIIKCQIAMNQILMQRFGN